MIHYLDYGTAVKAYVEQNLGADQLDVDYWVEQLRDNICVNHWDRAEPEPTEAQLEAALNKWNWDYVRKERNELLAATDFYALTDVPMSAGMTTYRQSLRDLPASTENSADVVFPTPPE
jgi:hypothetical protein